MIALPTILLATKAKDVLTIQSGGVFDKQFICLFASMKAMSTFKKRMNVNRKYRPIDFNAPAIIQSVMHHLEAGDIAGFAVVSTGEADEDILFHEVERPVALPVDARPIADAPHRHKAIKPIKRRHSKQRQD